MTEQDIREYVLRVLTNEASLFDDMTTFFWRNFTHIFEVEPELPEGGEDVDELYLIAGQMHYYDECGDLDEVVRRAVEVL
jgi:hypothetical protein